jgi:enoyl-CoA hydratase/carnithine racemase
MTYETITTELRGEVLLITLNRPDRLNAWTYQMGAELGDAINQANHSDDVTAMVLTGAGRGFCAGADIRDLFQAQAEGDKEAGGARPTRNWVELIRESKPIVAAVNGAAIGVGLTQILPCDYIIASSAAKLSARFIKMGLVPELASSRLLVARMGLGQASRIMLTGETLSAEQALETKLIDEMTDEASLVDTAIDMAAAMGANPQRALTMVKQLITDNMAEADLSSVQAREMVALNQCYESAEHHEAINAFLEKREPDFKAARAKASAE